MKNWVKNHDEANKSVLSSRIRIARNMEKIPFPDRLDNEKAKDVVKQIEGAFYTSSHMEDNFKSVHLWDNEKVKNSSYLEKHLISPKLMENSSKAAFIADKDETVSLMINEEDHVRIQCITSGLDLENAYDTADKLDNLLEESLNFAFDEKFGYLTACPTNMGTGLRASVMLHLPALVMNNEVNGVVNALAQVGMTIRGLYGEGSKGEGNIFQISNQITLGLSEKDIINNLKAVVSQIINQEYYTRQKLLENYKYELQDKIFRSLGILKSSVLLNSKECLDLISNVRFGAEMGIIKDVDIETLNELLIETQPATLQLNLNKKLDEKGRDIERAKYVREKISQVD